jgi:hypothetical protein
MRTGTSLQDTANHGGTTNAIALRPQLPMGNKAEQRPSLVKKSNNITSISSFEPPATGLMEAPPTVFAIARKQTNGREPVES